MRGRAMTSQVPTATQLPPPAGLEAVYLANRDKLIRFLRARGAGGAAEDLVQELWLRIVSSPSGPVVDPLSYLYRAANNLMLNAYRSDSRSLSREEAWMALNADTSADCAEATIAARQEVERARGRLSECGARVQEIFFLFRIEGMNQRAIAAQFGLSLSTVEKDIQRAYRAIAALRNEDDG